MTYAKLRRQRRNRQRSGVALFEALIVVSMLIILFASVVYFHNMYAAKTDALRTARMQAWQATEQSCKSQGHGKGSAVAVIPTPYVRASGRTASVTAGMEMTCNEHNSTDQDLLAVLYWAGLGDPIGDLFSHAADLLF